MKTRLGISLLIACLPWLAMAQNDDLYFVPKKEKKAETKTEVRQVTKQTTTTTTTTASVSPGKTVVVKDVTGKTRDIAEYNRRYTSRENTFSMQNDTLYIEEKPYGERGEWVNGFEGSQDDYEYAMRIIRFRSPAYAIPISSPLYWDVVYGAYPSWEWNVYDDGLYAYVFPTFSNPLWWDWRWNWSVAGPRWGYGWSWYSPWYYGGWYSSYWYGGYWGGWYAGYWGPWHHPYPYWGGAGWHHRPGFTDYRPTRYMTSGGSHTRPRYATSTSRPSRVTTGTLSQARGNSAVRRSSIGRVVQGSGTRGESQSVRPGRSVIRGNNAAGTMRPGSRSQGVYTRSSRSVDRTGSSYNRPSSTRRSVNYNNNNSFNRNSTTRSNSFNRSSGGSFNRSGGGSVSRGGGGVSRSSGGGGRRR